MEGRWREFTQMTKRISTALCGILVLYMLAGENYLFFHTLVEGICVVIGILVYILATRTYRFTEDRKIFFLGVAYLFISVIDSLHLLTFYGMGVFPELTKDAPTQLWIVGRFMEAISFCLVPCIANFQIPQRYMTGVYAACTGLAAVAILRWRVFPVCFAAGIGLTSFKIYSEYVIILLLFISIIELNRVKEKLHQNIFVIILASVTLTIVSEVSFTLYQDVSDSANFFGHILKVISYLLIFWGICLEGLDSPYSLIFCELHEKNQKLAELNEKKDQFLGIAAHDLRNPLSIISLSSQVLERSGTLEAKQAKFVERIKNSSDYMLQLVEELLDLSKIEAGKLQLNLAPCDLVQMVQNTLFLNQALALEKQIHLTLLQEETPLLMLDTLKMEQVVNNLISNAIKYSYPESKVIIRLETKRNRVILSVADEGQGIPEHEVPLLFTPYSKISVKATGGEKSTGLGLAISRKIVEGHRGTIWADSQVGKGSTFYVALPMSEVQGMCTAIASK